MSILFECSEEEAGSSVEKQIPEGKLWPALQRGDAKDLTYLRGLLSKSKNTIDLSTKRLFDDSKPLLHIAGNSSVARFLVEECGVDVNARDSRGRTALHNIAKITNKCGGTMDYESKRNDLDTCRYLIEVAGADVNMRDDQGNTCIQDLFFLAVVGGDIDDFQTLFNDFPNAINVNEVTNNDENSYGYSLFQMAVRRNKLDMVKFMAEKQGADVNAPAYRKLRPICDAQSISMIDFLLNQGTDLAQIVDEDTDDMPILTTVLLHAIKAGSVDLTRRIMTDYKMDGDHWLECKGEPLVHYAATEGKVDIVRYLIEERNANPYTRCHSGETVLHNAGTIEVAEYLITRHGLDPNLADDQGVTAAMKWMTTTMTRNCKFEQVQWLIQHVGVALDCKDHFGSTLLDYAKECVRQMEGRICDSVEPYFHTLYDTLDATRCGDDLERLHQLVNNTRSKDVDRLARDQDGNTWFLRACQANSLKHAGFWLLKDSYAHLTDVKAQNNRGETALHLVARNGNLEFLHWLVEQRESEDWLHGAIEKSGRTVLHTACHAGHLTIIECLVGKYGMNMLQPRDIDGRSALDHAIDAGHLDVMVWYNVSPLGLKNDLFGSQKQL